jgi:hypothetical protein
MLPRVNPRDRPTRALVGGAIRRLSNRGRADLTIRVIVVPKGIVGKTRAGATVRKDNTLAVSALPDGEMPLGLPTNPAAVRRCVNPAPHLPLRRTPVSR